MKAYGLALNSERSDDCFGHTINYFFFVGTFWVEKIIHSKLTYILNRYKIKISELSKRYA